MVVHTEFILQLAVLLIAASIGGVVASRFRYPSALGELIAGVLIGPYALSVVEHTEVLFVFAELGAIILLFYTGLEAEFDQLRKHVAQSMLVGAVGAVLPFILGYSTMLYLGYGEGQGLLVGAVLTATSLGITARILSDMGQLHTREGHIVMGAGVIDDILAVIILSVVLGVLSGTFSPTDVTLTVTKAIVFWAITLFVGMRILTRVFDRYSDGIESFLILLIALCFVGALVAGRIGISSIIGAFAVGLSLSKMRRIGYVREKLHSIYILFVPIFFVSTGMLIDIRTFGDIVIPGIVISLVAIAGKILGCGGVAYLAGWQKKEALRLGVAMTPRGEMGLAIASLGLATGYLGSEVYGIAVMAVAVTTITALPLLKILFRPSEHLVEAKHMNARSAQPAEHRD